MPFPHSVRKNLYVVTEEELVWVRTQAQRIVLFTFVARPQPKDVTISEDLFAGVFPGQSSQFHIICCVRCGTAFVFLSFLLLGFSQNHRAKAAFPYGNQRIGPDGRTNTNTCGDKFVLPQILVRMQTQEFVEKFHLFILRRGECATSLPLPHGSLWIGFPKSEQQY